MGECEVFMTVFPAAQTRFAFGLEMLGPAVVDQRVQAEADGVGLHVKRFGDRGIAQQPNLALNTRRTSRRRPGDSSRDITTALTLPEGDRKSVV